jgi:hypothetical protein
MVSFACIIEHPTCILCTYIDFFKTFLRLRCTIAFIYYGLTINIGKFGGNLYSNTAVSITAELLGYLMCFFLDKTGRKPLHLGVLFGSSVACFLSLIPILLLDECKYMMFQYICYILEVKCICKLSTWISQSKHKYSCSTCI